VKPGYKIDLLYALLRPGIENLEMTEQDHLSESQPDKVLLFKIVVFEILQVQLAGQLGMAHFSQFSCGSKPKFIEI
jgi:hypothetical protein